MDVYEEAMERYKKALAAWEAQSPVERAGEEALND
jgi:hypothetical protein